MTGLYDPSVERLIRGPLEHRWSVQFYDDADAPIPLDVMDAEITLDESWWPYVQGTITAVPTSQAALDALDPRRIVRCEVSAGYVLPGRVEDVHPIAGSLYLRSRTVRRPDNDVVLSVQGPEYLLGRGTELAGAADIIGLGTWDSTTPAREAIDACLAAAAEPLGWYPVGGSGWDYDGASRATGWAGDIYWDGSQWIDERYGAGLDNSGPVGVALEFARDIAQRVGAWLRCDETGVWRCTDYPRLASVSAHQLKTGPGGTIISSQTTMERTDDWANTAWVHVTWPDDSTPTGTQDLWGSAHVSSGPYAVSQVGVVATVVEREVKSYVPIDRVNVMAGRLLDQALTRGRSISLDAVAAYWLRPGHTSTVALPLGPQERHLVSAVTYRLAEGTMTVQTRTPDNSSEITIGG